MPGLVCTVHQLSQIRAFRVLLLVVAALSLRNHLMPDLVRRSAYDFDSSGGSSGFPTPFFPTTRARVQYIRSTGPNSA